MQKEARGAGRMVMASIMGSALLGGCAAVSAPPSVLKDPKVLRQQTEPGDVGVDAYIAFNRALAEAQANRADYTRQADFLNEGFALVTYRCNQYFAGLGAAEQDLRFARKQTTLASGLVLSMLGLAHATTKAVANTGALFSFSVASMDSYQDVYIYSPEVRTLQRLVLDALASHRKKVAKDTDVTQLTYTGVIDILADYEAHCQPQGIRDMVNQSLNQSKTTAEPAPPPRPTPEPTPAPTPAPEPAAPGAPGAPAPAQTRIKALPHVDVRVISR